MMIKGCIGFSYISGRLLGDMLIVRGKRVIHVPLPIGVYHIMKRLWRRENILGKFLFKESIKDFQSIVK
jgi:hypothetical protein